jgi:hypothetical protein
MKIIPLQSVKNQTTNIVIGGQYVVLNVYQKDGFGVFMDVYSAGVPIVVGQICQDRNRVVRSAYLGFAGDFCFIDNEGSADPDWTGIGSRFSLAYLETADLAH